MNMLQVIKNGAKSRGMSDGQLDNEYGAQARLTRAIYEMEQAIKMVNEESVLENIRLSAWTDFLHDEIPSTLGWDEKITRARS